MRAGLSLRLLLDGLAATLLLVGLAYYWLGNGAHEAIGTAFFVLLIGHNIINRFWYGTMPRAWRRPGMALDLGLIVLLASTMLVLLGTSVAISHAVSGLVGFDGGFTARQIHAFAGYWALILVALHLGLRWPTVMGAVRAALRLRPSRAGTWALRAAAAAIAAHGLHSAVVLDLRSKLTMRMTLDWWDFEADAAGFFLHCVAVGGLCACLTYYANRLIALRRR